MLFSPRRITLFLVILSTLKFRSSIENTSLILTGKNFIRDLNFELVTNISYDAAFVDFNGLTIMTTYNLIQNNA